MSRASETSKPSDHANHLRRAAAASAIKRNLVSLPMALALCLAFGSPARADDANAVVASAQTNTYVFDPDRSTIIQTGGIAGVDRTYAVEGAFVLSTDPNSATAVFTSVGATGTDASEVPLTLDPDEAFGLTGLTGMLTAMGGYVFDGQTADGSRVWISLTFVGDLVYLRGQTTPPANSADFFIFSIDAVAQLKYGGGTGTADNPYQIWTAEDLQAVGAHSEDWDQHFALMANIDWSQRGGAEFRSIGYVYTNRSFTGVFDGGGHTIVNLVAEHGLFGNVRQEPLGDEQSAVIRNLRLLFPRVMTAYSYAGALVAEFDSGRITNCRVEGGNIGASGVAGGLVGIMLWGATVERCITSGAVSGGTVVGGIAGGNGGIIRDCHTSMVVGGTSAIGGLVGMNAGYPVGIGTIINCYVTGRVTGDTDVGGLVGHAPGNVSNSFWDVETSGQPVSAGGEGKTTAQMQTLATFLEAGWDFTGETANGVEDVWWMDENRGYPLLWWEEPKYRGGTGEPNDPYRIATAENLIALGSSIEDYDAHFILTADIDLDPNLQAGGVFTRALIAPDPVSPRQDWRYPFTGSFDGGGHVIRNLHMNGRPDSYWIDCLGLFGHMGAVAQVKNLWIEDAVIVGRQFSVGGLAGENRGTITNCHVTGHVSGWICVGGLVGMNGRGEDVPSTDEGPSQVGGLIDEPLQGTITGCSADVDVEADPPEFSAEDVGGLVGRNAGRLIRGCRSSGSVTASYFAGGLVGSQGAGQIRDSYSESRVQGTELIGGLVGTNDGIIESCWSAGEVIAEAQFGGLVGAAFGSTLSSYWDVQASGVAVSAGGEGKTTAEMQTAATFLNAGWDFAGETGNGTDDLWWIDEGQDYPRLWWELEEQ